MEAQPLTWAGLSYPVPSADRMSVCNSTPEYFYYSYFLALNTSALKAGLVPPVTSERAAPDVPELFSLPLWFLDLLFLLPCSSWSISWVLWMMFLSPCSPNPQELRNFLLQAANLGTYIVHTFSVVIHKSSCFFPSALFFLFISSNAALLEIFCRFPTCVSCRFPTCELYLLNSPAGKCWSTTWQLFEEVGHTHRNLQV